MELQLTRSYYPTGTNGMLFHKSNFICFTIELPWLNNEHLHSCIPEGRYQLLMRYSEQFHEHFLVDGVANRTLILIHPANDALKELKGCIAPVMSLAGPGKGYQSRVALQKIKDLLPWFVSHDSVSHDSCPSAVIRGLTNHSPKRIPVFITIKSN